MPDPKSLARVKRLLNGQFRPDDLTNLFLYARDHCDGRESVAEIGHFAAHHHERDKGITTRSTREWFANIRYQAARYSDDGGVLPLDAQRLPSIAPEYFRSAAMRIESKTIREKAGLSRAEAHKALLAFAGRLVRNGDGTFGIPPNTTLTETRLLDLVSSVVVVKYVFEAERLVEEFFDTLKSNGLITKEELKRDRETLSILVQLHAVAAMHNCVVQIGDGTTVQLKGQAEETINRIAVCASVPFTQRIIMSAPMFVVHLAPSVHCHPDLIRREPWRDEVELGPERLLTPLK
jgi:hypothetical protein